MSTASGQVELNRPTTTTQKLKQQERVRPKVMASNIVVDKASPSPTDLSPVIPPERKNTTQDLPNSLISDNTPKGIGKQKQS